MTSFCSDPPVNPRIFGLYPSFFLLCLFAVVTIVSCCVHKLASSVWNGIYHCFFLLFSHLVTIKIGHKNLIKNFIITIINVFYFILKKHTISQNKRRFKGFLWRFTYYMYYYCCYLLTQPSGYPTTMLSYSKRAQIETRRLIISTIDYNIIKTSDL